MTFDDFYEGWDVSKRVDEVRLALDDKLFRSICEICWNAGATNAYTDTTNAIKRMQDRLDCLNS